MGLIKEFREFAMKGNVVDMAVGIVIGAGFGRIVQSLVNDIIMPSVGALAGKSTFGSQFWYLGTGQKPDTIEAAQKLHEPYIAWGPFAQTTLDFLIVALAVFGMVKLMNRARTFAEGAQEQAAPVNPKPPEDIQLLREIRDALTAKR